MAFLYKNLWWLFSMSQQASVYMLEKRVKDDSQSVDIKDHIYVFTLIFASQASL